MNKFVINGVVIQTEGDISSVRVSNGRITVNGVDVTPGGSVTAPVVNIQITGQVGELRVDACREVIVTGNAGSVNVTEGNARIGGNVSGRVTVGDGNVACSDVGGGVDVNDGTVTCGEVLGNVKVVDGNVNYRK